MSDSAASGAALSSAPPELPWHTAATTAPSLATVAR